jgi:hypothetical protein
MNQKYRLKGSLSTLIVIQPPNTWASILELNNISSMAHPLSVHLRYISSTIGNFREYLDYISTQIFKIVSIVRGFAPDQNLLSNYDPY